MVNNKLLVLAQKPNQGAAFSGSAEDSKNQIIVAADIGRISFTRMRVKHNVGAATLLKHVSDT